MCKRWWVQTALTVVNSKLSRDDSWQAFWPHYRLNTSDLITADHSLDTRFSSMAMPGSKLWHARKSFSKLLTLHHLLEPDKFNQGHQVHSRARHQNLVVNRLEGDPLNFCHTHRLSLSKHQQTGREKESCAFSFACWGRYKYCIKFSEGNSRVLAKRGI